MKTKNQTTFYFEYKIDTSGNSNGMQFPDVGTQVLSCFIEAGMRFEAREILVAKLVDLGIPTSCIWIKEVAIPSINDETPRGDWVNGKWVDDINDIYGEEVA